MCLLVHTHHSLTAERGWELTTSSGDSPQLPPAPAKGPTRSPGSRMGAYGCCPATACRGDGALLFPEKILAF